MARRKKIPKRLPPKTKEFAKLLRNLDAYIPEMAKLEKDSIALDNARQAILPEKETEKQKPVKIETPTQESPTTEPPTTEPPTTEPPTTEPPTTESPTTEPPTTEPPANNKSKKKKKNK